MCVCVCVCWVVGGGGEGGSNQFYSCETSSLTLETLSKVVADILTLILIIFRDVSHYMSSLTLSENKKKKKNVSSAVLLALVILSLVIFFVKNM